MASQAISGRAIYTLASLVVAIGALMLVTVADASQYNVGGEKGWTLDVNYTEWAANYTYNAGDTLFFKYAAQKHSVLQVSLDDYTNCNTNVSTSLFSDAKGDTTFSLAMPGKYWFICGVPTHCSTGHMKFSLGVTAAAGGPTSPPPTSAGATTGPAAFLLLLLLAPLTVLNFFFFFFF